MQRNVQNRTRKKIAIWLAFSFALGLHLILLLMPLGSHKPVLKTHQTTLELQLTTSQQQIAAPPASELDPEKTLPEPVPANPGKRQVVLEENPGPLPARTEPQAGVIATQLPPELGSMNETEKKQLTNKILARQFFNEESETARLFGKSVMQNSTEIRKDFHYPHKQNMLTMLDQPLPDLPFAYTHGLVNFAYEPGVKGDLQRFWDVITPEFGWRTKYGTEVKCILILVVAGCAWK